MSKRNYIRVLNKATAKRSHNLGRIGEQWAEAMLSRNGFTNIQNLNDELANHRYADIYAEKDGQRYVISVKTRNKLQASGALNGSYNLSSTGNHYELAALAEDAKQAKAAWIAIAVEETVFNAYFGLLTELNGKNGILMTETATAKYQSLVKNEPHELNYSQIKNVYEDAVPTGQQTGAKQITDAFSEIYPNISAWVQSGGLVELGKDYNVQSVIRALDEGGMIWEGETKYSTMDAAFEALDAGIAAFLQEQGIEL